MQRFAVIVAGGSGSRFGGSIPKQFAILAGKPVLFYSIEKFSAAGCEIVVVIPKDFTETWDSLCREFSFSIKHTVVPGGQTRTQSVKKGLDKIQGNGIVAVHDASRPLVSADLIEKLFNEANKKGNAVPAIAVEQSLRKVESGTSVSVNRDHYKIIQTPQCFEAEKLKSIYSRVNAEEYSDDASLFEASGGHIFLVNGESFNMKITNPHDLLFAEMFLKRGNI